MLTAQEVIFKKLFHKDCVKSVRILGYSGACFPLFGPDAGKYRQKDSEYGHVSRSESCIKMHLWLILSNNDLKALYAFCFSDITCRSSIYICDYWTKCNDGESLQEVH